MPKIIELTVEIDVQRVSCPGVWLCQDGRVSLSVYALGTSYQTCLLPPLFPLMFKDVFYFRKRFQETCALNNICCLLKEETLYCELVQWCEDCSMTECKVLAQYLGAINDVLFPPNMCSSDGVDLLMRRSKSFPGILSPKIEITTKVRIDEVWDQSIKSSNIKPIPCSCITSGFEASRQKQVCHSAQYHRRKCYTGKREPSLSRTKSLTRSRSGGSRSCCSLEPRATCECPSQKGKLRSRSPRRSPRSPPHASPAPGCPRTNSRQYCVYNVQTDDNAWRNAVYTPICSETSDYDDDFVRSSTDIDKQPPIIDAEPKTLLESRYIDTDTLQEHTHSYNKSYHTNTHSYNKSYHTNVTPCLCEICKRYHELFHTDLSTR